MSLQGFEPWTYWPPGERQTCLTDKFVARVGVLLKRVGFEITKVDVVFFENIAVSKDGLNVILAGGLTIGDRDLNLIATREIRAFQEILFPTVRRAMMPYLRSREAADEAEVTTVTIRAWCHRYGIGKRVGGRWRIDPERFRHVLNGALDKIEDHGERHP